MTPQRHIDEETVRRWIVEEVNKQLTPTNRLLESIDKWKLSLWSNGSGGPPGYLETARREDDDRYERLFKSVGELGDHKNNVTEFLTIYKERELQKSENRKLLLKIGGALGTALLSFFIWLAHVCTPAVKILWNDYVHAHPAVEQQLRNQSYEVNRPAYAEEEHATLPKVR
jgi:hypothetical protein